jgi:hypothetical protein
LRAIFPDNSGVGRGMHEAKRAAEFVGHRTRSADARPAARNPPCRSRDRRASARPGRRERSASGDHGPSWCGPSVAKGPKSQHACRATAAMPPAGGCLARHAPWPLPWPKVRSSPIPSGEPRRLAAGPDGEYLPCERCAERITRHRTY